MRLEALNCERSKAFHWKNWPMPLTLGYDLVSGVHSYVLDRSNYLPTAPSVRKLLPCCSFTKMKRKIPACYSWMLNKYWSTGSRLGQTAKNVSSDAHTTPP